MMLNLFIHIICGLVTGLNWNHLMQVGPSRAGDSQTGPDAFQSHNVQWNMKSTGTFKGGIMGLYFSLRNLVGRFCGVRQSSRFWWFCTSFAFWQLCCIWACGDYFHAGPYHTLQLFNISIASCRSELD